MSRVFRGPRWRQRLPAVGLVVVGLVFLPAAAGAAALGKTTVGHSDGGGLIADVKRADAYQLTAPALVSKLDIYLSPSGVSGTQVMEGVMYADAGGSPGALLAQTQQISFSSTSHAGWHDLPMGGVVTLQRSGPRPRGEAHAASRFPSRRAGARYGLPEWTRGCH